MISNPYKKDGKTKSELKPVVGDVSPLDYAFFKSKFPCGCTGITDKLVSTLYKKFIDELRLIDSATPITPSFYVTDPGFVLLDDLVARFGVHVGGTGGRDVERGTGGVREEVRSDEVLRPESQSSTTGRKRGKKFEKGVKEK